MTMERHKGKLWKSGLSSPSSFAIELKNVTDFNHQLQGELYRVLESGRKDEKFLNGDKGKHRKAYIKMQGGKKSFSLIFYRMHRNNIWVMIK